MQVVLTTNERGGQRGLEIRSLKARSKDFVWVARQATIPRAGNPREISLEMGEKSCG